MQKDIMHALNSKSNINVQNEIEERKQFLIDYLKQTKMKGYVLGISGGVDSTLSGRLAQLAVEQLQLHFQCRCALLRFQACLLSLSFRYLSERQF